VIGRIRQSIGDGVNRIANVLTLQLTSFAWSIGMEQVAEASWTVVVQP
jgi:hypothetical protein